MDAALTFAHHIADLVSLIDQLELREFTIVGQDWGGPQGVGAALQRIERLRALVLMNTWLFTGLVSKFHASPKPWTTWHAPLIGQFFMKRHKVLSQHGPSATTVRGMTRGGSSRVSSRIRRAGFGSRGADLAANDSDARRRSRLAGYAQMIERRLPELVSTPVLLLWAPGDEVFPIEFGNRLKELLPHAKGPIEFDRARHFCRTIAGRIWRLQSWSF